MTTTYIRETVATYQGPRRKITSPIASSRDVARFLRKVIPDAPQERFLAIHLDARNQPIGWTEVARGGLASCLVEPGAVFRPALVAGAHGVIVAHNHPSGDPTPSPDDLSLTARLVEAGRVLGVDVLDHVILGEGTAYVSMLDRGMMGGAR